MDLLRLGLELRLNLGLHLQALLGRLRAGVDFVERGNQIRQHECVGVLWAEEVAALFSQVRVMAFLVHGEEQLAMTPGDRSGIIAFHHEVSDDGQLALVEIVAADTPGLAAVLAQLQNISHVSGVQIFDRGKHGRKDIQKAFKAKKKDFDIDRFRVIVP